MCNMSNFFRQSNSVTVGIINFLQVGGCSQCEIDNLIVLEIARRGVGGGVISVYDQNLFRTRKEPVNPALRVRCFCFVANSFKTQKHSLLRGLIVGEKKRIAITMV